jgi:chloramphenicol O-acetyltransferase type A
MSIIKIDMDSYSRKSHFEYFKNMAYPYVGVTVNVDITDLLSAIRREKLPFFFTILYIVANAANKVPELRRRIAGDGIIEYSYCNTSHTVALEDGTYCYCELDSSMSYKDFLEYAEERQNSAKIQAVTEDGSEADSLLFVSCVPWISYTSVIQPVPNPADSNPRITFGRYFEQNNRILMPTTILVNHALADGMHIAEFYRNLDEIMTQLIAGLQV